ncbi:MAG: flagellar assembly protein FliW [Treponema bryantii]|jgi:flagellar assembly factor FliW|nr:flagellar assembly protein FliW [Treponema bryantii]MBR2107492.1 flagellar assembly protein FliW [Treponema sp.]
MEVLTKTNGVVQVQDDKILTFEEGLFGFEDYKKFALIDSEYEPFIWLQSIENQNLAFLIIDPFLVCSSYEADIDDSSLAKIGVTKPEDVVIMTIVTVPQDGSAITANFQGPLVINKQNKKCLQVILTDNRWTTKVDIVQTLNNKEVC